MGELLLRPCPARRTVVRGQCRVPDDTQQRPGQGRHITHRHQATVDSVLDDLTSPAGIGGDYRQAARTRFDQRGGARLPRRTPTRPRRRSEQLQDILAAAEHSHRILQSRIGQGLLDVGSTRAVADHQKGRFGVDGDDTGPSPNQIDMVLEWTQSSDDSHTGRSLPGGRSRCGCSDPG